ncbi:lytic transglycosylase domain-containing protein [Oceanicella actignis]|uniref:lytic transglycosylase domain-containing protein n=1 Tax=Oceanicella actignis TaxID=1189325 RepID=UPI0011E80DC4|nr:lytic transglycosylase domain-containing protein [Oceanicella actignis]TYO90720.1 soluble lytic murein transglycosylase [Oceanicella actignis]
MARIHRRRLPSGAATLFLLHAAPLAAAALGQAAAGAEGPAPLRAPLPAPRTEARIEAPARAAASTPDGAAPWATPAPPGRAAAPDARASGAAPLPSGPAARIVAEGLAAARRGDWPAALLAERALDAAAEPAGADLLRWLRLRAGEGRWREYADFLARNPGWPDAARLRRAAERAAADAPFDQAPPPAEIVAFFARTPPATGAGALMLAQALRAQGRIDAARAAARAAWRRLSLTPSEQRAFEREWGAALAGAHAERLDMLLWRGLSGEAMRMAPHLDADLMALMRARIALREGRPGAEAALAAVPARLAADPGLAHDRFAFLLARGRLDEAEALLLSRPPSEQGLGRPAAWARGRLLLAREALQQGRARDALRIVSGHGLDDGARMAELEWLAGWIALRRLDDPARALTHLRAFDAAVSTPVSKGRAGYWLGRALEAAGKADEARAAHARAAAFQTTFYGQLAAERIGAPPDPALTGATPLPDPERAPWLRGGLARAGALAAEAGAPDLARRLLTAAARQAPTRRDREALGALALDLGRPDIAIAIAKTTRAAEGDAPAALLYPIVDLGPPEPGVPRALALAVARQESELAPEAVSPAGARGLMQLMPATARKVASALGVDYSRDALTSEGRYNARLGQAYLAELMREFGAEPLAAAAYNAGPARVREWLERLGDPRRGQIEMLDWIESIPYPETRNYVMRVMESVHVYAARLSGAPQPLSLGARLGLR